MRALLVVLVLSGCSKYNVRKEDVPAKEIAIGQVRLVSVPAKGDWIWRRTPEEVVTALVSYTQSIGSALHACQAEVEKLAPKKAPKKPEPKPVVEAKK